MLWHKKSDEDSPGVAYPPPFLYVAGFLVGVGLERWAPLNAIWPEWLPPAAGTVVGMAGLLLAGWAIGLFFLARTAIYPSQPASIFVARGPYRVTRNPMYVSLALVYTGLAIFMRNAWAGLLLPLVLLVVTRFVIRREEAYLERRFGQTYRDYKQRVRRWL